MEKGEIWVVRLFSKEGREQEGIRPAIIISDTKTDLALLIPLTSNLESLEKLPFTLEIKKTKDNKLIKDSVALVFQLQAMDKRRLVSRIGNLEKFHLKKIDNLLKILLGF